MAIAIKLDSKGPVFFRQERVGALGKRFRVWKFRSMMDGAINQGLGVTVAKSDWRITRVGRILRDWGIDELPQLLNVFAGTMSIVGPRPTLAYQVEKYSDAQRRRLLMKPGISGMAVVRGRNSLSWEERIALDIDYVNNWSLWLDIQIIALTFWKVLVTREGLYGESGVNDDFTGSPVGSVDGKEL
jgi:lipopolysaccharide/colanic/teichoic acid biosynthesis glycosyltransferase